MHWKELQEKITEFAQGDEGLREDRIYSQALAQLRWDKGGQAISDNLEICRDFLDKKGGQTDKKKVEQVWLETVEPLADCVEEVHLERHGMLKAEDKKEFGVGCAGQAIQRMYDELTSVIGPTNASRLLHLRFPKLFVMTDERIRGYWVEEVRLHELFGLEKTELFGGYGYTFVFLPYIKSHAVDAIMTYANDKDVTTNEAIDQLQNLSGKRQTIARLMSEYYYAITR